METMPMRRLRRSVMCKEREHDQCVYRLEVVDEPPAQAYQLACACSCHDKGADREPALV